VKFDEYAHSFEHAVLTREGGVLEVALHSSGDSLVWGTGVHEELPEIFRAIASDAENRVLILTGAGDAFCRAADESLMSLGRTPEGWAHIQREGAEILNTLLGVGIPVIGAVNGPASIHAELAVLSDVVIAAEHAYFQDAAHIKFDVVPGDGVQVIWQRLLGPNRGRAFLLTAQKISAEDALGLGVVAEVVPADQLLPRAREVARTLASKSDLTLRHTREVLIEDTRAAIRADLARGFALEGLAMLSQEGSGTEGS
jgi:enoyl-CoA hydratase/carnithine racemase